MAELIETMPSFLAAPVLDAEHPQTDEGSLPLILPGTTDGC
jgi:hypothetical protein